MRVRRLAAELQARRRRLDAFRGSPPWPGKEPALRSELTHYDAHLLLAAEMLDVAAPDQESTPLAPDARAVLEDRLAHAGLDVLTSRRRGSGDVFEDDDLVL